MTLAAKRRLVIGCLAALAVWPLVHRVLVVRYELDPWRFFGWAMYCTPKMPVRVHLFTIDGGRRERVDIGTLARRQRQAVYALQRRRMVWGRLASPDRVGTALRAAYPEADAVEVEIERWALDPGSATIVARLTRYRYEQPAR